MLQIWSSHWVLVNNLTILWQISQIMQNQEIQDGFAFDREFSFRESIASIYIAPSLKGFRPLTLFSLNRLIAVSFLKTYSSTRLSHLSLQSGPARWLRQKLCVCFNKNHRPFWCPLCSDLRSTVYTPTPHKVAEPWAEFFLIPSPCLPH